MKTLIELYVNEPYDNLLAATMFTPDTVVYICSARLPDIISQNAIRRYLSRLNPSVAVDFVKTQTSGTGALIDTLNWVFKTYPDCVIDITGGQAPALIAAERYCAANSARAFYIDYSSCDIVNLYGMKEEELQTPFPKLSVPLMLSMGGACMTGSGHSTEALGNKRIMDCVRDVIRIYLAHKDKWSAATSYLQYALSRYGNEADECKFAAPDTIERNTGSLVTANIDILRKLDSVGAIVGLKATGGKIGFRFMNGFMKRALSITGMWLELLIYISALDSGSFTDVRMSVEFDWDGVLHGDYRDTKNELDVVAVRGLTPIFISCKSAAPKAEDLYEIWYLARRFGGKQAKPVIATAEPISISSRTVYRRALDMDIAIIESDDLLDNDAAKLLLNLTK